MDLGWDGRLVEGMRYYDGEDYRLGILMMALVAWLDRRPTHARVAQAWR